jgi:thiamine biosynthesis lipoprotein
MGTSWSLVLDASADAEAAGHAVDDAFRRIEALLSTWIPESELSRFNAARHGEWQALESETVEVLVAARRIGGLARGAFDVTVGPVVRLWGFGPDAAVGPPEPGALAAARARVGPDGFEARLHPPSARKLRHDVEIDVSGIAKGYAMDRAANALASLAIERFLLRLGGELLARSPEPADRLWTLAIEGTGRRISLARGAVSTSGDAAQRIDRGGRRYSHVVDPRLGEPVAHSVSAVTVVADTATEADAWSTALLVLGPEEGVEIADREGIAAHFTIHSGGDARTAATLESREFQRRFPDSSAVSPVSPGAAPARAAGRAVWAEVAVAILVLLASVAALRFGLRGRCAAADRGCRSCHAGVGPCAQDPAASPARSTSGWGRGP